MNIEVYSQHIAEQLIYRHFRLLKNRDFLILLYEFHTLFIFIFYNLK